MRLATAARAVANAYGVDAGFAIEVATRVLELALTVRRARQRRRAGAAAAYSRDAFPEH